MTGLVCVQVDTEHLHGGIHAQLPHQLLVPLDNLVAETPAHGAVLFEYQPPLVGSGPPPDDVRAVLQDLYGANGCRAVHIEGSSSALRPTTREDFAERPQRHAPVHLDDGLPDDVDAGLSEVEERVIEEDEDWDAIEDSIADEDSNPSTAGASGPHDGSSGSSGDGSPEASAGDAHTAADDAATIDASRDVGDDEDDRHFHFADSGSPASQGSPSPGGGAPPDEDADTGSKAPVDAMPGGAQASDENLDESDGEEAADAADGNDDGDPQVPPDGPDSDSVADDIDSALEDAVTDYGADQDAPATDMPQASDSDAAPALLLLPGASQLLCSCRAFLDSNNTCALRQGSCSVCGACTAMSALCGRCRTGRGCADGQRTEQLPLPWWRDGGCGDNRAGPPVQLEPQAGTQI